MGKKIVTEDVVSKALADLEAQLQSDDVVKASEDDLDQAEGADLGNPAKDKMSDAAKAKKAKKAMDKGDLTIEHEDGDDEDEDDGEEMEKKMKAKKAKKSFSEEMPEEIQTKIDVSEFLKSLVDHTGSTIEGLSQVIAKGEAHNDARYADLAVSVEDIQKSQAKIGIVLKAICEKIGVIAAAPARTAKADTVVKSAGAPAQRAFEAASAEVVEEKSKAFGSLSDNPVIAKSQISSALCDLVRKGEAEDLDVIGFESGGYIRPEVATKLKQVLN
jgi:hypothetical protein